MTMTQLQLISPDKIIVYDLTQYDQATITIGRNPNNDIVINSPEVDEYQTVIYLEPTQYQIIFLSNSGNTALNGVLVSEHDINKRQPYHGVVTFDTHQLVLLLDDQSSQQVPHSIPPSTEIVTQSEYISSNTNNYISIPFDDGNDIHLYPKDGETIDDFFDVSFLGYDGKPLFQVDAGDSIEFTIRIKNTGPIVATFQVHVWKHYEGICSTDWFDITYPRGQDSLNIMVDKEEEVTIKISPPNEPTSRAGDYDIKIIVQPLVDNKDYRGRLSHINATLKVNPFYLFSLEDSPSSLNLTLNYFDNNISIENKFSNQCNSNIDLRFTGNDDRNGCQFSFEHDNASENNRTQRAGKIETTLNVQESLILKTIIAPKEKYRFPWQKKFYFFDIIASSPNTEKTEVIHGKLEQRTFFVWPMFLLLVVVSLYALIFCSYPRIWTYQFSDTPYTTKTKVIQSDTAVGLKWQVFPPFFDVSINPELGDLAYASGTATVVPTANIVYQLKTESLVSQLIPFPSLFLSTTEDELQVYVTPIPPMIEFDAYPMSLVVGEKTELFWNVINADELYLRNQTTGAPAEDLSDQMQNGKIQIALEEDTTYRLEAKNKYVSTPSFDQIDIKVTTPTPVPPEIIAFRVAPSQILEGESVLIQWEVQNSDKVSILPANLGSTNLTGSVQDFPLQSQNYQLIAEKEGAQEVRSKLIPVIVKQPTATATPTGTASPTATPRAPLIELFVASRNSIILGEKEDGQVKDTRTILTWRVVGQPDELIDITQVRLEGPPDFGPVDVAFPEGELEVTITEERTTFILTAYNGDAKSNKTLALGVEKATETPEPTDTPEPPPTATPIANIFSFYAEYVDTPQDVISLGTENGNNVYDVNVRNQNGTNVRLSWAVGNVPTVKISGEQTFSGQPAEGSLIIVVNKMVVYTLNAGEGETEQSKQVILQVQSDSPPPPTNFRGTYSNNQNGLHWSYNNSAGENIIGFRIYRNDNISDPDEDYRIIMNEDELNAISREWTDEDVPTCGRGYYIVAVYYDAEAQKIRETTTSSGTSWNSESCPISTVTSNNQEAEKVEEVDAIDEP